MSELKVCRICLCKGVRVFKYDQFNLKQYYEEVLASKVNYRDGLPHYFCYMCATMLYKFHKFKEKCHMGQKTLKEVLWSGPFSRCEVLLNFFHTGINFQLTIKSISHIDRRSKNLVSSIDIININKRVKICNIKYKRIAKYSYDSDDSLDDKNLAEVKNVINNKDIHYSDDESIKIDIEKITVNEKLEVSDVDRIFDEDDDMNIEIVNINESVDKEDVEFKNKITVDEEKIIDIKRNNQKNNDKKKMRNNKERKPKRFKINKDPVQEKGKKFEVANTGKNYLDPDHWLKINLSEEEAVAEFAAKAQDPKYLAAPYKCIGCVKGFSKEDMMHRHIKLRHSESLGPIECRFCTMRFKWKSRLTKHITQHYAKYKCLRCNVICTLKDTALSHNAFHNGVIRKCMHCGELFKHSSTYYTHLRTHRSEHVCTVCGASFTSTIGLNIHKRMHITTVINPEEEVSTYCERCDIRFETRKGYDQHLSHSAMHAETGSLPEDIPAPAPLKDRKKSGRRNPRKLSTCAICNKTMPSYTAYMRHLAAEHKDEPIPKERHICEICGASILAGSVASHLNTHTREKLYPCATCGMQFNSKRTMTRHQLTHTGEKPFGCPLCVKRFTQIGSMKLHYRTFHLKEPYPKRNRRKNTGNDEEPDESFKFDRWR